MSRLLRPVSAGDATAVLTALRAALAGGDAILPTVSGVPTPTDLPAAVEQRVAVVIETSGSTGVPKRVALSADAMLASAAASDAALGGPGQWLLALPTHYIAGINVLVRSIAADTEPIVLAVGHFDARAFVAASLQLDAPLRFSAVVPAQLGRLVEAAEEEDAVLQQLRRFDRILVGGQATPASLIARARTLGLRISRTYGSSETSGGCVYDGVPIANSQARVVDGEVMLGGPMLAEGYLADAARTESAFVEIDQSRWYRTGDSGEITDGVLSVTGRLDGVIISGGVKVSLDAIEGVVRSLDGMQDAVVVRAPSAEWGEVPIVFTTARVSLADLKRMIVDRLGRASAPVAVVTLESIPQLPSGKPDRLALAAFAASRGSSAR